MPKMGSAKAEAPNLQAEDQYWPRPFRNWAAKQEVSFNVMCLDHPETVPPTPSLPRSVETLSSTKLVPGAKEAGDCRPKAAFPVALPKLRATPGIESTPSLANTTGPGVCPLATSSRPGRKLEMTQPKFL